MSGKIEACDLSSASTRQSSNQTSLQSYEAGEPTFVGIVHSPNDEVEQVCDDIDQRLAPDRELFTDWISKRDELRQSNTYEVAHNRAFDAVNYRMRFRQSLDEVVLNNYADRVLDGEHIVLVCYCSPGCYCHRKIVRNEIFERLAERRD